MATFEARASMTKDDTPLLRRCPPIKEINVFLLNRALSRIKAQSGLRRAASNGDIFGGGRLIPAS
jgi:hypothetical protein